MLFSPSRCEHKSRLNGGRNLENFKSLDGVPIPTALSHDSLFLGVRGQRREIDKINLSYTVFHSRDYMGSGGQSTIGHESDVVESNLCWW